MGDEEAKEVLRAFDPDSYVRSMSGGLPSDARLVLGQIESTTYLRNQLLRDSDWASMDHGIELRTPLVDTHLLESIKSKLSQFARFANKGLLANAPAKPLPRAVTQRRKTGFGIPAATWLAGRRPGSGESGSRRLAVDVCREFQAGQR